MNAGHLAAVGADGRPRRRDDRDHAVARRRADRGRDPVRRAVHPRGRWVACGCNAAGEARAARDAAVAAGDAEGAASAGSARRRCSGSSRASSRRRSTSRSGSSSRPRSATRGSSSSSRRSSSASWCSPTSRAPRCTRSAAARRSSPATRSTSWLSFIAGWAILLDYILLMAITAFATTDYVAVLFTPLSGGVAEFLFGAAVVVGRGVAEHPRRGLQALRALRLRRGLRPDPADDDRDPRAADRAQPRRADRPGERRRHAVGQGPGLRVHADARDVRGRRRLVRAGGRGRGRPQGAQAADDRAHAGLHPLRRHLARGGQRAAARPTCATAARTTTSTRRCSASPPPSTRSGWPTCCGS